MLVYISIISIHPESNESIPEFSRQKKLDLWFEDSWVSDEKRIGNMPVRNVVRFLSSADFFDKLGAFFFNSCIENRTLFYLKDLHPLTKNK